MWGMPAVILIAGVVGLGGCAQQPSQPTVLRTSAAVRDGYVHFASGSGVVCDTRPLSVDGSHARIEVAGACRTLRVTGEHNDVIVGMAPGGIITVTGAHNDIWWHMDGRGRLPDLRDAGSSNSFHREDG